ncbi:lipocalin-like domain-containing protein [Piscinibacter sp.]|uniref:lipocalin-like domain-containing protein n=1 Tax=Piscinibacter sp. TaxID=1903157 RepID=UPI0039E29B53
MRRRPLLLALAAAPLAGRAAPVQPGRALAFPRDHGAHPDARTEWWYATGWLAEPGSHEPRFGFQVTFFRSRTGIAPDHPSRFAASQLVFAHAALTDLAARRLRHDQRIARAGFGIAEAAGDDTRVALRGWRFERGGGIDASVYRAQLASDAAGFAFELELAATQPLLLQGDAGFSRKGPLPTQASHYYSQPQLAVRGTLVREGRAQAVQGRAWLDHEWSDEILPAEAVGWDWIGINLLDGGALTAFRLRRADGSALWAGGSLRAPGGPVRAFAPGEVRFEPLARWTSPASRAAYPVEWRIVTPAGTQRVRALLADQELDSRASTGAIYWEGLSELLDEGGRRIGLGYLEMTGYAARLRL